MLWDREVEPVVSSRENTQARLILLNSRLVCSGGSPTFQHNRLQKKTKREGEGVLRGTSFLLQRETHKYLEKIIFLI
jgi:hypothetical protein